jgi:hypothetical protein
MTEPRCHFFGFGKFQCTRPWGHGGVHSFTMADGKVVEKPYQPLPTQVDLHIVSLEDCALRMKPARSYELRVGARMWTFAIALARHMGANVPEHPFAPYINVIQDEELEPLEWYIKGADGEAYGSDPK